jgi:hypothetical protein
VAGVHGEDPLEQIGVRAMADGDEPLDWSAAEALAISGTSRPVSAPWNVIVKGPPTGPLVEVTIR